MLLRTIDIFSRQFLMRCLLTFKSVLAWFCSLLQGLAQNLTSTSLFLLQLNIVMVDTGKAQRTWLGRDNQRKVPRGQRRMRQRVAPSRGRRDTASWTETWLSEAMKDFKGSGSGKMFLVSAWPQNRQKRGVREMVGELLYSHEATWLARWVFYSWTTVYWLGLRASI